MKNSHIDNFKHLSKDYDYRRFVDDKRIYLYDYDVQLRNPIVIQAWGYAVKAFMCNEATSFKEEMYDHSAKLEAMLNDKISLNEIDDIFNKDSDYKKFKTKTYRIKDIKPEAAQYIINRNINVSNRLNEYILEKQMIEQIESA